MYRGAFGVSRIETTMWDLRMVLEWVLEKGFYELPCEAIVTDTRGVRHQASAHRHIRTRLLSGSGTDQREIKQTLLGVKRGPDSV